MTFSKNWNTTLLFSVFYISAFAQGIGKKIKIDPYHYTSQKDIAGKNGVVACAHPLAAKSQPGYIAAGW